jgi:hypothetical protein
MESTTFDAVSRNLGSSLTRRAALRGMVAGALAVVAGGTVLDVDAKKLGKRKKNKKSGATGRAGSGTGNGTGGGNQNGTGGGDQDGTGGSQSGSGGGNQNGTGGGNQQGSGAS